MPEDSKVVSFSESDARSWTATGRLFKDHGFADYSCRFSRSKERNQVYLNTSNHREAEKRAAELFRLVSQSGWEVGLALGGRSAIWIFSNETLSPCLNHPV